MKTNKIDGGVMVNSTREPTPEERARIMETLCKGEHGIISPGPAARTPHECWRVGYMSLHIDIDPPEDFSDPEIRHWLEGRAKAQADLDGELGRRFELGAMCGLLVGVLIGVGFGAYFL